MPVSTWFDLFSDFQQDLREYAEKLPITPRQFMRTITTGISEFQKRAEILQAAKSIPLGPDGSFYLGDDVATIISVADQNGYELLSSSFDQQRRIDEADDIGLHDAGRNFSYRVARDIDRSVSSVRRGKLEYLNNIYPTRGYAKFRNRIVIQPYLGDTSVRVRYVLFYHPFSQSSVPWAPWMVSEIAFENLFNTTGVPDELSQWERTYIDYSLMRHLRGVGNQLAEMYKQDFESAIIDAIALKQTFFKEGQSDYHSTPWS